MNGPKNKSLPGKPDIVLPKYHTVIFVHGCFWHGRSHSQFFSISAFQLLPHRARDLRNENAIRSHGWHVVPIWECALRKKRDLACSKSGCQG